MIIPSMVTSLQMRKAEPYDSQLLIESLTHAARSHILPVR
jgi:hypothetical protein